jgi:hypothetical protein
MKYFNIILLKEISAVLFKAHRDVLYFMSNVLFIFFLLAKGIGYLLILPNIPEDGSYVDGCWKVEINNLYILWRIGYVLLILVSARS